MKHLTDDEIQSYLQEGKPDSSTQVKHHLGACAHCRKQLFLYEKLGGMVISTASVPTPKDFEKSVMKRLRSTQRERRVSDFFMAVLSIGSLLSAGIVILLTPQIRQVVFGYLIDAWHFTFQITSDNGVITESLAIPIIGILFLVLFAVIDRSIASKLRTARQARN